jgi:uncharacterized protein YecE (DUF72 family)
MVIKVGTCGFTYKHFEYFEALEVQQTFYDVVGETTLKNWKKRAGDRVEFTVKALQVITHEYNKVTYKRMKKFKGNENNFGFFKHTEEVIKAYEITLNEAKTLGSKVIVFQTPSSFKPTEENINNLKQFFSSVEKGIIYAWEPRGDEWYKMDLKSLFDELGIIHVVDPFRHSSVTKDKYYRLHGIGGGEVNYSYKYTDDDLKKLAEIVLKDENVYVMFNNIYSFEDALRFKRYLEGMSK